MLEKEKNDLKQMVLTQLSTLTNQVIEEVRKYQVCVVFLISDDFL
jgi:hypothetical protein